MGGGDGDIFLALIIYQVNSPEALKDFFGEM